MGKRIAQALRVIEQALFAQPISFAVRGFLLGCGYCRLVNRLHLDGIVVIHGLDKCNEASDPDQGDDGVGGFHVSPATQLGKAFSCVNCLRFRIVQRVVIHADTLAPCDIRAGQID